VRRGVAAVAILACSALLTACQTSPDRASVQQPRPESLNRIVLPAQPRSPAGLPRCRHNQLRASYTGHNGVGGFVLVIYVVVTDIGRSACYLRGTPRLIAYDTHGRPIHRRGPYPTHLPQDHGPKVALFPHASNPRLRSASANFTTNGTAPNGEPCSTEPTVKQLYLRPPSIRAIVVHLHPRRRDLQRVASCGGIFNPERFHPDD
jgi:hypothetical protein